MNNEELTVMTKDLDSTILPGVRMNRLKVWLSNTRHFHHRIMMRYLRKRGWVVFYLEKEHRKCNGQCWLELYESELRRYGEL